MRPDGEGLVLYAQVDHARVSGDCATMLREVAGDGALVAAARLHDNGWREEDERPLLDGSGRPFSFDGFPHARYLEVWRRGIDRALEVDRLVGLLVMLHGARFFARSEDPAFRAYHAELCERGDEVLGALGRGGSLEAPPQDVLRQSAWLGFLDAVSLVVCGAPEWARRPSVGGTRFELTPRGREVRVAPFPFRERFEVVIEARRLDAARFDSQAALDAAFASAALREERYDVVP